MSQEGAQDDPDDALITEGDVEEQLSLLEQIKAVFDVDDDYFAAVLANQTQLYRLLGRTNDLLGSINEQVGGEPVVIPDDDGTTDQPTTQPADDGPAAEVIAWPAPPTPGAGEFTQNEVGRHVGTAQAKTTFDFQDGTVTINEGGSVTRTEDLTGSLADLQSDRIRSLHLNFTTPFEWFIPGQTVGRYQESQLSLAVSDVDLDELVIKVDGTAQGQVFASTTPRIPIDPSGIETQATWIGTDPDDGDNADITVGTEFETINWAGESELYRSPTFITSDVYVGETRTVGLHVDSDDATDVHLSVQGKNSFHVGRFNQFDNVPFTDVDGWSEANPKVVSGNESDLFMLDFPWRLFQLSAKAASGTADFQVSLTELSE